MKRGSKKTNDHAWSGPQMQIHQSLHGNMETNQTAASWIVEFVPPVKEDEGDTEFFTKKVTKKATEHHHHHSKKKKQVSAELLNMLISLQRGERTKDWLETWFVLESH